MNRKTEDMLKCILCRPGCTQEEVRLATGLARSTVGDHLKKMSEQGWLDVRGAARGKRALQYAVNPDRISELLEQVETTSALILGAHATRRFDADCFKTLSTRVQDRSSYSPGLFDIKSIIHAAVATGPGLTIQDWSPRFEELVRQTTPRLLPSLHERSLKYIAPREEESWLGSQGVPPLFFDWRVAGAVPDSNACYHERGIWESISKPDSAGTVDGLAFQLTDTRGNPIFLEFYLAPQRSFYGFQSILMNVADRVISTKEQRTKEAQYKIFHHTIRTPLQRLALAQKKLDVAADLEPDEFARWVRSVGEIARNLDGHLASFPVMQDSEPVDVPVLAQLSDAIESIRFTRAAANRDASTDDSIHVDYRALDQARTRYLSKTIPQLQFGAFHSFLTNAVTHGRSRSGATITFAEVRDGHDLKLRIIISDLGKGVSDTELESFNIDADTVGRAESSDIARVGGLRLAIMGVKTSHGKVIFNHSKGKAWTGLTVDILLPVTEIITSSHSESEFESELENFQ
ncbi:winged helix-turn-helix transcriptional regulator [uncultured Erythrobacter sp.]|uniref:winged helix-turn-helix transcriptional regulator n=1 Tax=uncultured Erythrobacter sp. TaxID=263913 RepID=UPI002629492B|nr:winged helix-turn-helix transcriptional regulator [uncultured Erythrobacter sp.]